MVWSFPEYCIIGHLILVIRLVILVLTIIKFTDSVHSWIKKLVIPVSWKTYYGSGHVF